MRKGGQSSFPSFQTNWRMKMEKIKTPTLYDPCDENGIDADMSDEGFNGNKVYYKDDVLKLGTGQEELAIDQLTKAFEQAEKNGETI